ncbi:hypothetical protein M9H77_12578 [Catharanthus roseus]|uniref:Uncharacterized protein n=1 Tax=Catharanthus roseus TaxID=4058 RepID=A0ACC0BHR4_CATRO|nr:hypothetical protein M9H77_12578 [Catharanthus roseus]
MPGRTGPARAAHCGFDLFMLPSSRRYLLPSAPRRGRRFTALLGAVRSQSFCCAAGSSDTAARDFGLADRLESTMKRKRKEPLASIGNKMAAPLYLKRRLRNTPVVLEVLKCFKNVGFSPLSLPAVVADDNQLRRDQ